MSFDGPLVSPPLSTVPTSISVGPIQGSSETALQFVAGSAAKLVSPDFPIGSGGDFSGLGAFTVEAWIRMDSGAARTIELIQGPQTSSVGPVQQWAIGTNSSGVFSFEITDNAAHTKHTLNGTAVFALGTWYHIVGVWSTPNATLYVNGAQDATSSFGAITVDPMASTANKLGLTMFADSVDSWSVAEVALYRKALSSTRIAAHYTAGAQRGWNSQKSGARIGAVLDTAASDAPRSLQTGVRSVVPRYMAGLTALSASQDARNADFVDSGLFIARTGTVTYLAADNRSNSPYNTSQGTYGDGGGAELQYLDRETDFSDAYLSNDWQVTAEGTSAVPGITQESSDSTSIASYGNRTSSVPLPVVSDADALTVAAAQLAKYKDPFERVTKINPNMADPATAVNVYQRDLMDKITVKWTPPGGGSRPSQDVFVQSIKHSGTPGVPPSCEFGLSPL